MDEATKKWITIMVPFTERPVPWDEDAVGARGTGLWPRSVTASRAGREVAIAEADVGAAVLRAWPASEPSDRAKRLAVIAERDAAPETTWSAGLDRQDRRYLLSEVHAADAALAALGVTDDGRPLAERIAAAFEAVHAALDPVVARRDARDAPPLPLATRAATAARIADDLSTRSEKLTDEVMRARRWRIRHGDEKPRLVSLGQDHRWVTIIFREGLQLPSTVGFFEERQDAERFYGFEGAQWSEAFLCEIVRGPGGYDRDEVRPPASVPPPDAADPDDPREGPMHEWFSLTRASHLVLPRVILQSMTVPWQRQLVGLLEQARAACEAAGVGLAGSYYVRALDGEGRLTDEDLPHYRHAPLLGDPAWADAPRATRDEDDPVELEREEATDEAFAEAVRIVERLKGRAVASPEEMRQAALVALTLRSSALEQLVADPARRAAFNAVPPELAALYAREAELGDQIDAHEHADPPTAPPEALVLAYRETGEQIRAAERAALAALGPPRIVVTPVEPIDRSEVSAFVDGPGRHGVETVTLLRYPESPCGKGIRDLRLLAKVKVSALARALRIGPEEVHGLEHGSRTTDDAGWTEIMTSLFRLGSGTPAEEIADPIGSGALDRALARAEEPDLLAEHLGAAADREDAARPAGDLLIEGAMPPAPEVVFIFDPGDHGPCHAAVKDVSGQWSRARRTLCGEEPYTGPIPWVAEPQGLVCQRCRALVEKGGLVWRVRAEKPAQMPPPEPDEADQTVGDLDPGPYVCPGCHTVAGHCLPGCIDAEIERRREEEAETDPGEGEGEGEDG